MSNIDEFEKDDSLKESSKNSKNEFDSNENDSSEHSSYNVKSTDSDPELKHHLSGMYQNWFLDYASYVILERAVPHVIDGPKPVQRRILHSRTSLADGRSHKVSNINGTTLE